MDRRAALRDLVASYARVDPPGTIAIVGNAPMPRDPDRARLIDGSDLVVRMTTFALDGAALGTRCDVVVLHRGVIASPYTFADYTNRLYLLVEPGRLHWERADIPRHWPADLGFTPVSNYEFTLPLLDLLGLDRREPLWSTTGTLATYVLTELFPHATTRLTGMSLVDNPVQTTFEHAWGAAVHVTPEHRLEREAELLRRWHAEGRIELLP
ncbi:hypothetical protein [Saccharothrix obliqua]|uniref:hypothetical protein n=1 Tax=Saccharothrix obliqua TaxID=2861747 RepID=UPI0027E38583|nr:hypothetical protein [Saccharothrix obliqua]